MRFNINDKSHLLPEGEYEFSVVAASEKESTNGNEMMVLKLGVGSNGKSRIITDYILASNIRKVRAVAKSCDLLDLFQAGEILPEHFVGRQGRAKLVVEKGARNFPDRNVVDIYLAPRSEKRSKP